MPAQQTKRWTLAELHRLPDDDGNKYEVVHGELFVTPAPNLMVRQPPEGARASWDNAPVPVLVVEMLSDSTRRRDFMQKRALYMEIGIPEYWIVDGNERTVHVIRQDGYEAMLELGRLVWQPAGVAEPLTIELAKLFGG